jgi:hypothetical protein
MRLTAQLISWLALLATVSLAGLFFADRLTLPQMQAWLLSATVVWFISAPLWMGRKSR